VHVRGGVTFYRPGEFLWIRDGHQGLRIELKQTDPLSVGDIVDVLGFPNRGEFAPVLEDGRFRKTATGQPPTPVTLTNTAVDHDADLVQLQGTIVKATPVFEGTIIELDWGGNTVKALLHLAPNETLPPDWRIGSRVRATGICTVTPKEAGPVSGLFQPHSFHLLLRSQADLRIMAPPPWWTLQKVLWLCAGVACLSLLLVVRTSFVARKRVREQQNRRALAEAEFSGILNERNRMAREIHDTLAQGLGAISVRLELAKTHMETDPASVARHLEIAHGLVRNSLGDARSSIWQMRSQVLESGDLVSALDKILHQLTDATSIEAETLVTGQPRRLPPNTENDLLRIGQEAITNATKHASAKRIELKLEFTEKQIRLTVRDDGQGFNPAQSFIADNSFGLVGMRERADQLHGELTVQSNLGQGTEISLTVPTAT